jgi:zinc and cadmium transporter
MTDLYIYISLFFSALLSGVLIVIFKLKISSIHRLLLSFSGAFLLAICILHLIPELYENYNKQIGLFILIGFVLQLLLEFFSKGIEHGHFHDHDKKATLFPFAIFISLCLHAFIEGTALINPEHNHASYNGSLLLGIIIHKIPIAIVLTTMLISKNTSKSLTIFALGVFSISAPAGLYLGKLIGHTNHDSINILLALAVGIFLHISTTILFETSEGHKFDVKKFGVILLGLIAAIFTL